MGSFLMQLFYHLLLTFLIHAVSMRSPGLKFVRVTIPQYCMPGETVQIRCDYDIGNDTLYSVKWYKENEEFYRFVPKDKPKANWYKVEGIEVDVSQSDSMKVVLKNVNWQTSGLFKCEVSAEAPSFASAQSEAVLEVVSLPTEDPIITGVEMQYQIGDVINLNCTSGKSHPASIIHWYINEQQIQNPEALIHYPQTNHDQDLISSTLGLTFILNSRHFLGGSMRVKCVASLAQVLFRGDRESAVQSLPIRDMREALLLVKSSTSKSDPSILLILLILILRTVLQLT